MLHIVNQSPFSHSALADCLRVCDDDSAIVLIENGVYAAIADNTWAQQLLQKNKTIYVLETDVAARGLNEKIAKNFTRIDYADFVQLCCKHDRIHSWY